MSHWKLNEFYEVLVAKTFGVEYAKVLKFAPPPTYVRLVTATTFYIYPVFVFITSFCCRERWCVTSSLSFRLLSPLSARMQHKLHSWHVAIGLD